MSFTAKIVYAIAELLAYDWVKEKAKALLHSQRNNIELEFNSIMQDYNGDDQTRIKKFFNDLIDTTLNDIPKNEESFQSIINEGDFYPLFDLDPNWDLNELYTHLRIALRAKLIRDSGLNHENFHFCIIC